MMEFLCTVGDVPDGGVKLLVVRGRRIAVARLGEDVYAIEDACPHWGGPLSEGAVSVKRREIACPWHRFRYNLKTGACVASTGRAAARTFSVRIAEGRVLADIPPAPAVQKGDAI